APSPPPGSYVRWEVQRIDATVQPAPWATEILARYNRSLCAIATAATGDLPCRGPTSPAEAYVGNAECARCHPDDLAVYEKTPHARARSTLTAAGKECDVG